MDHSSLSHLFLLFFLVFLPCSTPLPHHLHSEELHLLQQQLDSSEENVRNDLDWQWQRTGFHFQPTHNWMNDPNGPLYYKGVYHLFYQWNPFAAVWGNITWGHAVSKDMIRWSHVKDLALVPDRWYDIKGVWSGSATFVNGHPVLLYTGWSNSTTQLQNKAIPKDPSDPLLREWIKDDSVNPIAVAPNGINQSDFRDPTTAWIGHDGEWRMLIGSKHRVNNSGIILQYRSKDFGRWELLPDVLHEVAGTGMWECPDFFPVFVYGRNGVEEYTDSSNGVVKYVVKVSLDEKRWDTYVVGEYDPVKEKFEPVSESLDIGNALRYDYGIYYASKTFYDPVKKRRVLFGWISEADLPASDVRKGWASLQGIPRHIWLDESMKALVQWPIEELNSLRERHATVKKGVVLKSGETLELGGTKGSQLDIEAVFEIPLHLHDEDFGSWSESKVEGIPNNTLYYCNQTFPAAEEVVGPFGMYVLASGDLSEKTAVFFKLLKFKAGWKTIVCNDLTSSSLASDSTKGVYGSTVDIRKRELSLRVLVDHSIVETFAQGGRTCITARSYPLLGKDNIAHLFFFNNGTAPVKVKHLSVWRMNSVRYLTL